jgi:nucleoside-diphosphate-sugar epimerase
MTTMSTQPLALVIGATGAFGGEVAGRLVTEGWRVRALHRDPDRVRSAAPALEWVRGDAMAREAVLRAAEGARVVVHAANPPGYRNWRGLALPMLENTVAAARAAGARTLFPGNVYNFGPDAFPRLSESSPQRPTTRKGAIRVEMERRLAEAAQDGAKVLILRAGDFFGAPAGGGWMDQILGQAGTPIRSLTYPGPQDVRHAWAYLPDLAEAAVRLLAVEDELSAHASFHFAGHALTGRELIAAFENVLRRSVRVRPLPWPALYAAAPFNETLRELLEMRYLWRKPVLLDNARLVAALGAEPRTPLEAALEATLRTAGRLDAPPREDAPAAAEPQAC